MFGGNSRNNNRNIRNSRNSRNSRNNNRNNNFDNDYVIPDVVDSFGSMGIGGGNNNRNNNNPNNRNNRKYNIAVGGRDNKRGSDNNNTYSALTSSFTRCDSTNHSNDFYNPRAQAPKVKTFASEQKRIAELVESSHDIEIGGDLFGVWDANGNPQIVYALGPGPKARGTQVAFFQDEDYLELNGNALGKMGLEHIGEWHSHHKLGLEHPSGGDCRTVHKALRDYERDRFLLCIATLQPESSSGGDRGYGGRGYSNSRYNTRNARNVNYKANLRAFIFSRSSAKYTEGKIDTSPSDSPFANKFTPQLPPSSSSANSGSSSGSSSSSSSTGDGAQWYMDKNTEFGTALFTKLNSYLKMESQNGKVGISRSTTTQDISLSFAYPTLEYKCTLSFLCDFPSSKAHLHIAAADPQASSDTADVEVAFSTDGDNALSFVDKILKKAKIMAQTIDLSASVSASAPSSLSSLSSSSYALPGNGAGGGHRNYRNNRNTRGNNNGGNNFATNNNSTTNSALNSTPSNFRRVISSDNPLGAGHPSSSSLSSSASASSSSSSSSPSASPSAAPFQPKLGDFVDARDMKGYWYRAKVIFVDNGKYKCHFPEFASKWDEWKSLADMAAMGTHTGENTVETKTNQWYTTSEGKELLAALIKDSKEILKTPVDISRRGTSQLLTFSFLSPKRGLQCSVVFPFDFPYTPTGVIIDERNPEPLEFDVDNGETSESFVRVLRQMIMGIEHATNPANNVHNMAKLRQNEGNNWWDRDQVGRQLHKTIASLFLKEMGVGTVMEVGADRQMACRFYYAAKGRKSKTVVSFSANFPYASVRIDMDSFRRHGTCRLGFDPYSRQTPVTNARIQKFVDNVRQKIWKITKK